jgi:subtilase family serine protease
MLDMFFNTNLQKSKWILGASLGCALVASSTLGAQKSIEAPKITEVSADHGPAQPLGERTLTVHLKMHDEAAFDKALEALYTPGSSTFQHWLTPSEIAKYAPTASEVETVKKELEAHGLSIVSVGSNNLSIRTRGSVTNIEGAFHTQIHEFEREGKTFQANVTPAGLTGEAGNLVKGVSGLSNFQLKSYAKLQVSPRTGKQTAKIPIAKITGSQLGQYFTNNCFPGPSAVSLTTDGASLPIGQYYGNLYDPGTLTCGWTPAQVQAHYGLTAAYKQGLDGSGQTIVLVDGPSDPTVADDLKAFSTLVGLPAITSSNFQIIYPDGVPSQLELQEVSNWDTEADLDIEWAHAIAPKAKIVLLIAPTQDWSELEYAIQYAQEHKLGNVSSNSYGYPELLWGAQTLKGFDQVLKVAAASGIAVNFSSGDGGDEGTGSPDAGGASYPASSTYATAIGGTSIGLPNGSGGLAEVGWGNNAIYLSFGSNFVLDPPESIGFLGGAGGGESTFISKPSWQKGIPGSGRQEPDVSAFADPYTGAIFVSGGAISVIGGTSLASPVFSAIWALTDQNAGHSLGQAAPLLAKLPSTALNDVVPLSSPTNPAGIVFDSAGATYYSSDALLAPLYTTKKYYSGIWDLGGGEDVDISFGTDSSLTSTTGWDNVTGLGVPNGLTFIKAVTALK